MTTKELLCAIAEASDAGTAKVGIYLPPITRAARNKRGFTTITLQFRVDDITPNDVMNGVTAYVAIGRNDVLKTLMQPAAKEGART